MNHVRSLNTATVSKFVQRCVNYNLTLRLLIVRSLFMLNMTVTPAAPKDIRVQSCVTLPPQGCNNQVLQFVKPSVTSTSMAAFLLYSQCAHHCHSATSPMYIIVVNRPQVAPFSVYFFADSAVRCKITCTVLVTTLFISAGELCALSSFNYLPVIVRSIAARKNVRWMGYVKSNRSHTQSKKRTMGS